MKFVQLVETARKVASRGARKAKQEALASLIRATPLELIRPTVAMLSGELPTGRLGIGYATVRKARTEIESRTHVEDPELSVADVLERLNVIGSVRGRGSKAKKEQLLAELLATAAYRERDFLCRLMLGELRQGALAGVMVEALSQASGVSRASVRRAVMLSGDLPAVAEAAASGGDDALSAFRLELFRPLQPMLASPVDDITAAETRLVSNAKRLGHGDGSETNVWKLVSLEPKIDGARVQVHRDGDEVRVYSRQLNDVSASVPEVCELALSLNCATTVLDGECFAINEDGSPKPFQETMRRFGRKQNVSALRERLPLRTRFFDCLYRDHSELVDLAYETRRARLEELVGDAAIPRTQVTSRAQAENSLERALEHGHEGLMAKMNGGSYEAGSRGFSWLKIKPAHTLDLVVLAAEWGSGRRQGWLSNLHLGARDEVSGELVMLGKTFKGLTDEMLVWQTEQLQAIATERSDWVVHVEPRLVVEIAFNNIQASSQYPAGMALRFARVKRYRDDKDASDASTLAEVRAHFERDHGTS